MSYHCRHFEDTRECYDEVKALAEGYWSTRQNSQKSVNYSFAEDVAWSLGPMLLQREFDLGATLLYQGERTIAFAGLRSFGDYTLCMGRFFCLTSVKPLGTAFILPIHLDISKKRNFIGSYFTLNHYNAHIKHYYLNRLPKLKSTIAQQAYESLRQFNYVGLKEINHVEQHVFECRF